MSVWVYGRNAVLDLLRSGRAGVTRVLIAAGAGDARVKELIDLARRSGIRIERRAAGAFAAVIGEDAVHQGVAAEMGERKYADPGALLAAAPDRPLFVVFDGVEDPRNVGAVVRSAAAAGADAVFLPDRRAAGLSPGALKSASGAAERIPVARIGNVVEFLKILKKHDIWVVGLDASAPTPWTDFDMTLPIALVLGSEGGGLRRLARRTCDALVSIPLCGGIESLNLSVAAGVALFEAVRQRRRAGLGRFCE